MTWRTKWAAGHRFHVVLQRREQFPPIVGLEGSVLLSDVVRVKERHVIGYRFNDTGAVQLHVARWGKIGMPVERDDALCIVLEPLDRQVRVIIDADHQGVCISHGLKLCLLTGFNPRDMIAVTDGHKWPLAPAELPKQAASFNSPICLGLLAGSGQLVSEYR